MTQVPTSQSVMAKLRTKQFVTVRRRRVVKTDKITSVLPTTVTNISSINMATTNAFGHAIPIRYESTDGGRVEVDIISIVAIGLEEEEEGEEFMKELAVEEEELVVLMSAMLLEILEITYVGGLPLPSGNVELAGHVKLPSNAMPGVTATKASGECENLLLTFSNVFMLRSTILANNEDVGDAAGDASNDIVDDVAGNTFEDIAALVEAA